jgi:hypothetical protein
MTRRSSGDKESPDERQTALLRSCQAHYGVPGELLQKLVEREAHPDYVPRVLRLQAELARTESRTTRTQVKD